MQLINFSIFMKKTDALFELIKSLSKSEKRYFTLYSLRHVIGNENKYMQLFEAIENQKEYNENALIKKFKDEKFSRRLGVAKAYLYEMILRSMNEYHVQSSTEAEVRALLGNVAFLYRKGLYDAAMKIALKTKKLCVNSELLHFIPIIISWQKKILEMEFFADAPGNTLKEIYSEETEVIEKLNNINNYWLLQARLYQHHHQQGIARHPNDIDTISVVFNDPLVKNENEAQCFESLLLLYKIYATYFFITRDVTNCYNYSKKLTVLIESRAELINIDPLTYIYAINNLLNTTGMLGKTEEKSIYLQKLYQLMQSATLKKWQTVQIKLFEAYHYHCMHTCVSEGDFEKALPLVANVEQGLKYYKNKIDKVGKIMLCFYCFHSCFGAGKFIQAHEWLHKIIDDENATLRRDIFRFSKILTLLTAYEINDKEILKNTLKSVYGFLYKGEHLYQFETIVMQFIRRVAYLPNVQVIDGEFKMLLRELNNLYSNNFEKKAFAYFDFPLWVQGKLKLTTSEPLH